jgi:hypothetical protein
LQQELQNAQGMKQEELKALEVEENQRIDRLDKRFQMKYNM